MFDYNRLCVLLNLLCWIPMMINCLKICTSKKTITRTSCILLTQQIGFLLYDIRKFPLKELMEDTYTICCHLRHHPSPISTSNCWTTFPFSYNPQFQRCAWCFTTWKIVLHTKKSNLVTTNSTSLLLVACFLFGFQLHLTHSKLSK